MINISIISGQHQPVHFIDVVRNDLGSLIIFVGEIIDFNSIRKSFAELMSRLDEALRKFSIWFNIIDLEGEVDVFILSCLHWMSRGVEFFKKMFYNFEVMCGFIADRVGLGLI